MKSGQLQINELATILNQHFQWNKARKHGWAVGSVRPSRAERPPQPKRLGQCAVYLSGLRLADGELLVAASGGLVQDAVEVYGLRREIETLFGCLKGAGP